MVSRRHYISDSHVHESLLYVCVDDRTMLVLYSVQEMRMNTRLLKTGIRVWPIETLVSGFNFLVLMNIIYQPRWGTLVAHQIGMSTRIVYIFVLTYFLLRYVKEYDIKDLILIGLVWLGLEAIFEWGGSFILGRPVEEILVGWNIFAGYM